MENQLSGFIKAEMAITEEKKVATMDVILFYDDSGKCSAFVQLSQSVALFRSTTTAFIFSNRRWTVGIEKRFQGKGFTEFRLAHNSSRVFLPLLGGKSFPVFPKTGILV